MLPVRNGETEAQARLRSTSHNSASLEKGRGKDPSPKLPQAAWKSGPPSLGFRLGFCLLSALVTVGRSFPAPQLPYPPIRWAKGQPPRRAAGTIC